MSLIAAIELAKRGYAVLPTLVDKTPLTPHGVYSASSDPLVFCRYPWDRACCAVATGEVSGIDVLDVDLRARPISRPTAERERVSLSDAKGVNGFETLAALGLSLPETLCTSTPSGGRHYWFKHIVGSRSKDLGPGVEWFSDKKFVLVPPAPHREWLNDLAVAEAPEVLAMLVLAIRVPSWTSFGLHEGMERNSPARPLAEPFKKAEPSKNVPKQLYLLILRLMRVASSRDQRCAIRVLAMLCTKRQGRNKALYWASCRFYDLFKERIVTKADACTLLVEACRLNGYLDKDGEEAVRSTVMSGLRLKEWPGQTKEPR